MPVAEIIAIGTELLLGEIQDTNSQYIARAIRDAGIDLYRTSAVGDNLQRIAQLIQEALTRADIVITTGGLGPTVDDPTRQAVADALGVSIEFRPELWAQVQERFQRYGRVPSENNKKQAYLPVGAVAVENPVGTAPAFICEMGSQCILSLPGVPKEMEFLLQNTVMPYLRDRYRLSGMIKARVLHVASLGESRVDEKVADLELLKNPTVGLLAHPGVTDVRITAKAQTEQEADEMIDQVVSEVINRLGGAIYGVDTQTLEETVLAAAVKENLTLSTIEFGMNGGLLQRLSAKPGPFLGGALINENLSPAELYQRVAASRQNRPADLSIGAGLSTGGDTSTLHLVMVSSTKRLEAARSYGGPPQNAITWAINNSLDFIRTNLSGKD